MIVHEVAPRHRARGVEPFARDTAIGPDVVVPGCRGARDVFLRHRARDGIVEIIGHGRRARAIGHALLLSSETWDNLSMNEFLKLMSRYASFLAIAVILAIPIFLGKNVFPSWIFAIPALEIGFGIFIVILGIATACAALHGLVQWLSRGRIRR